MKRQKILLATILFLLLGSCERRYIIFEPYCDPNYTCACLEDFYIVNASKTDTLLLEVLVDTAWVHNFKNGVNKYYGFPYYTVSKDSLKKSVIQYQASDQRSLLTLKFFSQVLRKDTLKIAVWPYLAKKHIRKKISPQDTLFMFSTYFLYSEIQVTKMQVTNLKSGYKSMYPAKYLDQENKKFWMIYDYSSHYVDSPEDLERACNEPAANYFSPEIKK